MKKSSLTALIVLFSIGLIVFACRKEIENSAHSREGVSSVVLESAKIWYLQHRDTETGKARLTPHWKYSWTAEADGGTVMIVPASERYINNKDIKIRRFFIFHTSGNRILEGNIVEFLGKKYDVEANLDYLIKNYRKNTVSPAFRDSSISTSALLRVHFDENLKPAVEFSDTALPELKKQC